MTPLPPEPLVPDNTLITRTPEEGRALAVTLARHSIHAMQKEIEVLKRGRAQYADDPLWADRGKPCRGGGVRHDRRG